MRLISFPRSFNFRPQKSPQARRRWRRKATGPGFIYPAVAKLSRRVWLFVCMNIRFGGYLRRRPYARKLRHSIRARNPQTTRKEAAESFRRTVLPPAAGPSLILLCHEDAYPEWVALFEQSSSSDYGRRNERRGASLARHRSAVGVRILIGSLSGRAPALPCHRSGGQASSTEPQTRRRRLNTRRKGQTDALRLGF